MSIEVCNESPDGVDIERAHDLCAFVLEAMRINPRAQLSVLAVDEGTMTAHHVRFMDEPGPTDVLSFPMDELRPAKDDEDPPAGLLGDIVVCPSVARRQGEAAGHGYVAELDLLIVHGLLHLLGYDHAEPDDQAEMFSLQKHLLTDWRRGRGEPVGNTMAAAPVERP